MMTRREEPEKGAGAYKGRHPRDEHLAAAIKRVVRELTPLQVHDLAMRGLRAKPVWRLVTAYRLIEADAVLRAIGIGERALRRAQEESRRLGANVSDRVLRLAAVTMQAIDVLGSQESAKRWLSGPVMGLDSRKPIDLVQTTGETELVKTLLTQLEYGVYV